MRLQAPIEVIMPPMEEIVAELNKRGWGPPKVRARAVKIVPGMCDDERVVTYLCDCKCSECGTLVNEKWVYCIGCGAMLEKMDKYI